MGGHDHTLVDNFGDIWAKFRRLGRHLATFLCHFGQHLDDLVDIFGYIWATWETFGQNLGDFPDIRPHLFWFNLLLIYIRHFGPLYLDRSTDPFNLKILSVQTSTSSDNHIIYTYNCSKLVSCFYNVTFAIVNDVILRNIKVLAHSIIIQ